jgi:hypothetical protein
MKKGMNLFILGITLILGGCGTMDAMSPLPDIIETEHQNVSSCRRLGAVSELIDPGKVFLFLEIRRTKKRVIQRAVDLGATHIVWEYQNRQAMAATAYTCSTGEP